MKGLSGDLVGLAGLASVCGGVYLLWGVGWALIAAGVPPLLAYVWREVRMARGRGRS